MRCHEIGYLQSALLLALAVWSLSIGRPLLGAEPPNVVLIFADDMRFDGLSANGNRQVKTPHLDRLASEGTTFRRTYLQGANSGATCIPSRAQLLTGRGVFDIGDGIGRKFAPEWTTFAQAFQAGGYFTQIIGKSHNEAESSMRGFMGGARLYGLSSGPYRPHYALPFQDFRDDGRYNKNHLYLLTRLNPDERLDPFANKAVEGAHNTEVFGTAAIDFIASYERSQPFFLYLAFHAPHDPRQSPPEYRELYKDDEIELPPNFLPQSPFEFGEHECRDELLAPYPRTTEDTKRQLADYYGNISHLDSQVGQVIAALKARGVYEKTIIAMSSDSGLALGSHGLFGKQSLYDNGATHVPMIFAGPEIPKGKQTEALMYTFDIYPTLCDLAGVPIPASVKGQSMKSALVSNAPGRELLTFAFKDSVRALNDGRYKLIEYAWQGKRFTQLFDIIKDPYEVNNLADSDDYRDLLARLRAQLAATREDDAAWGADFWAAYKDDFTKEARE